MRTTTTQRHSSDYARPTTFAGGGWVVGDTRRHYTDVVDPTRKSRESLDRWLGEVDRLTGKGS